MCELLGMCFNTSVNADFSFGGFLQRSNSNPDGWGIAFYPQEGRAAQIIKEPFNGEISLLAQFIKQYDKIRSSIYMSHIRYATSKVSYANTHPFCITYRGREYIFAHNGVLRGEYRNELKTGRWTPVGDTDSEYAFCYLMNVIEENDVQEWNHDTFSILEDAMLKINEFGNFNCMISDGEYLFCYHDKGGYKGLCYVKRQFPFNSVKLVDGDFEINLSESKNQNESGYVIATKRLTNEEWKNCVPGKVMAFSKGECIFPKESIGEDSNYNEEQLLAALRYIRNKPERAELYMVGNVIGIGINQTKSILAKLMELGYIKQDSRDDVNNNSEFATFYTIREKRGEIDRLLADDFKSSTIKLDDIDCVNANSEDKTPICTSCNIIYNKGKAYCRSCNCKLEIIDTKILDIIFRLNEKGYHTQASCSGHSEDIQAYIMIDSNIEENYKLDGFNIERNRDGKTIIRSILGEKKKSSIRQKGNIPKRVDVECKLSQNMNSLRRWLEIIPDKTES